MGRGPNSTIPIPKIPAVSIDTFWKHVQKAGEDECWSWVGDSVRGYGRFRVRGRNILATRISYLLSSGEDPLGKCVLHRCDNPPCCNPKHLYLGSHQDNMIDMVKKGRHNTNFGELCWNTKLSTDDIKAIRTAYIPRRVTLKTIGAKYGITLGAVHLIVSRKSWNHVA